MLINYGNHNTFRTAERLTRNNLEFAGLAVYACVLAIVFTIALIAMLFASETKRFGSISPPAPEIRIRFLDLG